MDKERSPIATEKKKRNLIALDETVVKANKKRYYVFSAVDVERNELILMKVYPTYCENKPKFIIDKAPWLKRALERLNLEFKHETFRKA